MPNSALTAALLVRVEDRKMSFAARLALFPVPVLLSCPRHRLLRRVSAGSKNITAGCMVSCRAFQHQGNASWKAAASLTVNDAQTHHLGPGALGISDDTFFLAEHLKYQPEK